MNILIMDNTSLSSIVEAAGSFISKETKLHALILNAGIMAVLYEATVNGDRNPDASQLPCALASSILSSSNSVSNCLKEEPSAVRIVCVSSHGQKEKPFGVTKMLYDDSEIEKFGNLGHYGLSKFGNVLHLKILHAQYGPGSEESNKGMGRFGRHSCTAE